MASRPSRRRKFSEVQEISFDAQARQEYLTGFHKRKQQRIKHAQHEAAKRERIEKVESRRLLRDKRKADLDQHVLEVNALLQYSNSINADPHSRSDAPEQTDFETALHTTTAHTQDNGYVDEDQYAKVTVEPMHIGLEIDEVDTTEDIDGQDRNDNVSRNDNVDLRCYADSQRADNTKDGRKRMRGRGVVKRARFRYESKAERKLTRVKQQGKKNAAARARKGIS